MALSVCCIFAVTIGTFPAVTVDVKTTVENPGLWGEECACVFVCICLGWSFFAGCYFSLSCSKIVYLSMTETYFIPVSCFLLFNLMDWAGRSLTAVCMWVSIVCVCVRACVYFQETQSKWLLRNFPRMQEVCFSFPEESHVTSVPYTTFFFPQAHWVD